MEVVIVCSSAMEVVIACSSSMEVVIVVVVVWR